ncbi:hypothetical protein TSUD_79760 [Trifolium subterraneum]|uniref:Alpha-L-fucosidase n=1 Tax=Trifolium subterraneum TaxID=3900 RepID=A0A2Z6MAJ7_TRISU|nr:hypothetical protein TSUD_79760 [Trifolium subterraneum]
MELLGEKVRQVIMSWVVISTVLTLVIVPSCSVSVTEAKECSFPAIFNFGDSNSDTGGLAAAFGQVPPPNGITFFNTPVGRYSDGRLIIDFLAQNFGLPYLSAYLDSVGSNFSNGANFATAGSTIRPHNKTLSQSGYSPVSLDVQFVEYSDFKAKSILIRKKVS